MVRNRKQVRFFAVLLCLAGAFSAAAQKPEPAKSPKPKTEVFTPTPTPPKFPSLPRLAHVTTEKSIAVDPNVSIKLCVSEGSLKINGWERSEVRVFVKSGRLIGFKVLEKDPTSQKPNWLLISNVAAEGARPAPMSECLAGDEIELDVPMKASLSLSGRVTETTIDSIKKVNVKTVEGDISLRNISGGISAATYQGDLMVENSGGAISLETTTGNILAFEVSPGQIGDLFKAKTNSGAISLQRVEHRQIEANTITGSVLFNGKFLSGGLYNFKTSNGAIRMVLPEKSSCKITASYGFGSFNSAFPLKIIYETDSPGGKNLLATIGAGDANVNLTTNNGSIAIKKQ